MLCFSPSDTLVCSMISDYPHYPQVVLIYTQIHIRVTSVLSSSGQLLFCCQIRVTVIKILLKGSLLWLKLCSLCPAVGTGRSQSGGPTWSLLKALYTAMPCRKLHFPKTAATRWVCTHTVSSTVIIHDIHPLTACQSSWVIFLQYVICTYAQTCSLKLTLNP